MSKFNGDSGRSSAVGASMNVDLDRVRSAAREATTEDLLDRVTFYRGGIESDALELLEQELWRRGVTAAQKEEHAESLRPRVLWERPDVAVQCAFCHRPATRIEKRWHRLLGVIPLFPSRVPCCTAHATPATPETVGPNTHATHS